MTSTSSSIKPGYPPVYYYIGKEAADGDADQGKLAAHKDDPSESTPAASPQPSPRPPLYYIGSEAGDIADQGNIATDIDAEVLKSESSIAGGSRQLSHESAEEVASEHADTDIFVAIEAPVFMGESTEFPELLPTDVAVEHPSCGARASALEDANVADVSEPRTSPSLVPPPAVTACTQSPACDVKVAASVPAVATAPLQAVASRSGSGSVLLDEDDLDEDERAVLAEVAKKGYYHGRPKNQVTAPPEPVLLHTASASGSDDASACGSGIARADGVSGRRTDVDQFQQKWDKFGRDDFVGGLEAGYGMQEGKVGHSTEVGVTLDQALGKKAATTAAKKSMLHSCGRSPVEVFGAIIAVAGE